MHILGPMDDGIGVDQVRTAILISVGGRKSWQALELRAMRYYEANAYKNSDWVLSLFTPGSERVMGWTPGLPQARHCPVATEQDVPNRVEVLKSFSEAIAQTASFLLAG